MLNGTPAQLPDGAWAFLWRGLLTGTSGMIITSFAIVYLGAVLVELLAGAWVLWRQTQSLARAQVTTLRIRTPMNAVKDGPRPQRDPDDDLFRAIAAAFPIRGRIWGRAPWMAWTMRGQSNLPIDLGVAVASFDPRSHQRFVDSISNAIQSVSPMARVTTEVTDPLAAAFTTDSVVAWRTWKLRLGAEYPIRLLDDVQSSVLQANILTALQPRRNVRLTEAQVVMQTATGFGGWTLHRGWRGRATALKLRIDAKHDWALSEDSKALEVKLDSTPYLVTLRVGVVARGPNAADDAAAGLDQVEAALGAYAARTASVLQQFVCDRSGSTVIPNLAPTSRCLLPLTKRMPSPLLWTSLCLPFQPWRRPLILGSQEAAGLWHLPTPDLGNLVRWLPCRVLPAPPQAFAEHARQPRIIIGHSRRSDGYTAPVGPTLFDLRQPMHLTAGMGAGKTRLLANMCQQMLSAGLTLIDGKGDDRGGSLVTTLRKLIAIPDEERVVILDTLDTDWPIGINPLAGIDLTRTGAADLVLGQILSVFSRIDPANWASGTTMQQLLQMCTLVAAEGAEHPTIATAKQALVDANYRATLLPKVRNPEVRYFWEYIQPHSGEGEHKSRDALLRRFDKLLTSETTRYIVTQAQPTFSFERAVEEKLIVLCPLADLALGDLAGVIGMLLFQAFVRAAFGRSGDTLSRETYPLVVDELQVLIGQGDGRDVATALSRLRSLGFAAVYAHQVLDQLGELVDMMRINIGHRVILQTKEPDASVYAKDFAAMGITASDIIQQDPLEHQYVSMLCEGQPTGLMSMEPLMWPEPVDATAPSYNGPDWQTLVPRDTPSVFTDHQILDLVYHPPRDTERIRALAQTTSAADWQTIRDRWAAIAAVQRQYILQHPGCISDRMERQLWLSRLRFATPRILAEVEYYRQLPDLVMSPKGSVATHGSSAGTQPGRKARGVAPLDHPSTNAALVDPKDEQLRAPVINHLAWNDGTDNDDLD